MSCDVKAIGTLKFDTVDALDEVRAHLDDDDDDSVAEVRELVEQGTSRDGATLRIAIDGSLTADANMWFQDWLEDAAAAAVDGHVDTWQEDFGDSKYVRIHAGGDEEVIESPFARP